MTAEAANRQTDGVVELAVQNLGVLQQVGLVLGPGMTAITGETGAGKTLVLTALQLLVGGRAEATMVGPHGDEAVVEGRLVLDGIEHVARRVVTRTGRSRAYLDGRLATASALAELGGSLLEIHGQSSSQVLGTAAAQRAALDGFAGVDLAPLVAVRGRRRELEARLAELGGDHRERLRQAELYRYQASEIDAAELDDPHEQQRLADEASLLADAEAHRRAAGAVAETLGGDGPVDDSVRAVLAEVADRAPLAAVAERLAGIAAELADVASEARHIGESIEDDPERLAAIDRRRQLIADLQRKYGDSISEVLAYRSRIEAELNALEQHDAVAAELGAELDELAAREVELAAAVGAARRAAAPELAARVTAQLASLALPNASLAVTVGADDPGDDVTMLFTANPGAPELALAKVASGGELARVMLALRLVLSAGPPTMVFDEVDAGVGGAAALAVGEALAQVAADRQVLVVTHLPQVAASATNQVAIVKDDDGSTVSVGATVVEGEARVVELSRMLSGSPDSDRARAHAAELLGSSAPGGQASG